MKFDITNIVVGCALPIMAFSIGTKLELGSDFQVINLVEVLISVSMLIVANEALSTWKSQFRHKLLYESFLRIEKSFDSYHVSEIELWNDSYSKYKTSETSFMQAHEKVDVRNKCFREYCLSWKEVSLVNPKFSEFHESLSPSSLQVQYRSLHQRLRKPDFKLEHDLPDNDFSEIYGLAISSFQKERLKLS
ncbi:TPA: hypothetical protein ACMDVK_004487 [Vibrio parahaemolyticus]|nr:hypothetical protein [Vibrio vulnificus]ELX4180534.1 hypothetical protein [Vibrio vulnificus]